ncbi:uncharacterized protein LOC112349591 [Selaginella moellendorffii]|uniref:uncharacterized protein LOC112349591 n=1 Tax=Selaginella moellendorffii TaxID=88036 RepID=UPI000D1CD076|nr:uncharacterized protein LOC112349591 [Selaginella moellendorffii]|eukprot:XP_024540030.1 uncharacterized protein LOC112349591 [Selaginella moellendorffii]
MASLQLQERALGATLGLIAGAGAVLYERRLLWRSTAITGHALSGGNMPLPPPIPPPEPLFGKKDREELAHAWNLSIDRYFKPIIAELSARGW